MNFFERRRVRKGAKEVLRQTRHLKNIRSDIMPAKDLEKLEQLEAKVRELLASGDYPALDRAADDLHTAAVRLTPKRLYHGFSENFEILVVAVAVAWGFRAYFIQPFKIPTGSMQPTLYGVHSASNHTPGWMDRMPLKLVKWCVTGQWYTEVYAKASGQISMPSQTDDQTKLIYVIGNQRHYLPRDVILQPFGRYVRQGELLWAGVSIAGDHVFVDKVRWNFTRPKLDQVMVFTTDNIAGLPQDQHYIKRLTGLPGDSIRIAEPNLVLNGTAIGADYPGIYRVASKKDGMYAGYRNEGLLPPDQVIDIPARSYWAMGDNTRQSKDSRYWGFVPEPNMVGPACYVYWPFSERFGRIQ